VHEVLAKTPSIITALADGAAVTKGEACADSDAASSEAAKVTVVLDADDCPNEPANAAAEVVEDFELAESCVAVTAAVAMLFGAVESSSAAALACVADVLAADAADEPDVELTFDSSVFSKEASDPKSAAFVTSESSLESEFTLSLLPVAAAFKAEVESVESANLVTVEVDVFPAAMSAKVDVSVEEDAVTAP
jgi:hypothetical protein